MKHVMINPFLHNKILNLCNPKNLQAMNQMNEWMNEVLRPVNNNGHVGRTYKYCNALNNESNVTQIIIVFDVKDNIVGKREMLGLYSPTTFFFFFIRNCKFECNTTSDLLMV